MKRKQSAKRIYTYIYIYILLAFLLVTIALLIAPSIYCDMMKYRAKQKYLTNNDLKKGVY